MQKISINIKFFLIVFSFLLFGNNLLFSQEYKSTIVWDNGEKKEEGILKDGKQKGVWIYWNEAGKIIEKRQYVKGILIANEKRFYDTGKLLEIKKFNSDKILIEQKIFEGSDTTKYFQHLYFDSGKEKSKGSMIDNMLAGVWEFFNERGEKIEERNYNGKHYLQTLFSEGIKKEEGDIYYSDKNGEWKKWNKKGEVIEVEIYEEGKLIKRIKNEYYSHTKGLLYDQKTFNDSNVLIQHREYTFQDNNRYIVNNYNKGIKISSGKMIGGEPIGKWVYYTEDGNIDEVKKISESDTITIAENNKLIVPTKANSIIKFYRDKKYPPSQKLNNGIALNDENYSVLVNGEEIVQIANGSFYEYEIKSEGVYRLESLYTDESINLFVKLGRSYFIKCKVLDEEPEGLLELKIVDPSIGVNEFNKVVKIR